MSITVEIMRMLKSLKLMAADAFYHGTFVYAFYHRTFEQIYLWGNTFFTETAIKSTFNAGFFKSVPIRLSRNYVTDTKNSLWFFKKTECRFKFLVKKFTSAEIFKSVQQVERSLWLNSICTVKRFLKANLPFHVSFSCKKTIF